MKKLNTRTEADSLGEVKVPQDKYWGAQTERAIQHFSIGQEKMPIKVIQALALIKREAAKTHVELNLLSFEKAKLIEQAASEILSGKLNNHFPLTIWQSGSGTQTNMNVNEVISNRAIEIDGGKLGSKDPIHPNDDANLSQSSNDVFSSAMHIASVMQFTKQLLPALTVMRDEFEKKQQEFKHIIKIGRTHLQDAVPLTLGQEFSGYVAQINANIDRINQACLGLLSLPLGGTAVGTGLNAHPDFTEKTIRKISDSTDLPFKVADNKFALIASHDALVFASGVLKTLAASMMKIANDIRWLASGPRCGLGELTLPANEPGSSIMPGKINPTQCEMIRMVCAQVIGNDVTIGLSGSQGDFELNVFKPVMIFNLLQSIQLLSNASLSFTQYALKELKASQSHIKKTVSHSLMLVTILVPHIGYDKAAEIAQHAHKKECTLRQAAMDLNYLSGEEFDRLVQVEEMIHS